MTQQEQEWVHGFEGLDERRILAVPLPPNLGDEETFRFRQLQEEAAAMVRKSREQALLQKALQEVTAAARLQPPLKFTEPDSEEDETGPRQVAVARRNPLPALAVPSGKTDTLLDRQIASCAGIIEHLAHYIARCDTAVESCNKFMDRIGLLMHASAEAAIAAGRLRGMAPEGRRRR